MISTELDQLVRHMEWADAKIWGTVLELAPAREDSRIRTLLHHIHTVHRVYLQLWRNEPVSVPELDEFSDLPSLYRWARSYYGDLPGVLASLDSRALDRELEIPWADRLIERFGRVPPTDLRQSLLQVTSHSSYHRGQVNTRIREVGGQPPSIDFVVWVWAGQPEANWPSAEEA